MGIISILLMIVAGLAFWGLSLITSHLLIKKSSNRNKSLPYECGMISAGDILHQQSIGYFKFALIFLIFEVELMYLYPWATVAKQIGLRGFIEICIFILLLLLGLVYAHKKNVLNWSKNV
ncbi:MAG: NADH-quinone oxidoreductase subunit A [Sediminibacterium sp.]|nr:NADH-quinone oxidoreductase subunit A [Sediminibacterium sp.]